MAPMAFILGGICGTFSAVFSWLLFGVSLWGAAQVYFAVGLTVAAVLIVVAMVSPRKGAKSSHPKKSAGMQRA